MKKLKKELEKQRREISRLEKLLQRYETEESQHLEETPQLPAPKNNIASCSKCKGETRRLELGKYSYHVCDWCNSREKIK